MGTRDLNKIMLTGQVEAEPEMRFTAEGEPFTTCYISSARHDADTTSTRERFRLIAWGDPLADRCNELLQGARILVEGRLQTCTADDEDERARFPFEVRVREIFPLGTERGAAASGISPSPAPPVRAPAPSAPPRRPASTRESLAQAAGSPASAAAPLRTVAPAATRAPARPTPPGVPGLRRAVSPAAPDAAMTTKPVPARETLPSADLPI